MIHYLKRNQLDIQKYDACVQSAINSRIYAYSWYLDVVADNWDALILNDYEAVMPLSFLRTRKYLFIKKIMQPPFCQQLGVFYTKPTSEEIMKSFYSKFIEQNPIVYNFNSLNYLGLSSKIIERDNYELSLSKSYDDIFSCYSKNLKRNINKAKQFELTIKKNIAIDFLIKMKKDTTKIKLKRGQFEILSVLLQKLILNNSGTAFGVFYNDKLIASAFFMNEKNRITHLISSTTKLGKEVFAIPFLFDNIIKQNISKNVIFDFEGSMIRGVARFFKSFGAEPIKYNSFKRNE